MDEFTNNGFLIVTVDKELIRNMSPNAIKWFLSFGGQCIVLDSTTTVPIQGARVLKETNGVLSNFLRNWDCNCLVVRPDKYIYGGGNKLDDIIEMLRAIQLSFDPKSSVHF